MHQIYRVVTFEMIPEEVIEPIAEKVLQLPSDISYNLEFINLNEESSYIIFTMFMPICVVIIFTLYFLANYCIYRYAKAMDFMPERRINFKRRYLEAYSFYPRTLIELSLELSALGLV